mmetsp:Transcript_25513/g.53692  ORF Transcript_25513/g.53692 Transcript_25513/m.53692 type:complete len:643 (-) Transcript_25513:99-2027(-)
MNDTDSTDKIDNYLVKSAADSSSSSSGTQHRMNPSRSNHSWTHFRHEKIPATNSKDGRGESVFDAASALSMLGDGRNASGQLSMASGLQENFMAQRNFASKSGAKTGENDDGGDSSKQYASSKKKTPLAAHKPATKHKLPKKMPIIPKQRHIPAHKKSSCALTFPEKLLAMLDCADKMKTQLADQGHEPDTFCMSWLPDGKSFLVRDPVACTQTIIPLFFKQAKFTSITRKLYRWGFHQVERHDSEGPPLPPDAMIFANENFQRDARHKIANMKSMTTSNQRRKSESTPKSEGGEVERTSSPAITAGSDTQHLNAAASADARKHSDGNGVLSSECARSSQQSLVLPSIVASVSLQSQQSQKQALLQGILKACDGNLARVDPNILKTLLLSQVNDGASKFQSSNNVVKAPAVANTTPRPTSDLDQLLPLLRNYDGGNQMNCRLHHQQHQHQHQDSEKQSLLQSMGLKSPYAVATNRTSMGQHHHHPSQSLPQQILSSFRSGNSHDNSLASGNNMFDQFMPYTQSTSINTNTIVQGASIPNGMNFSRLAQQQKHQLSLDDANVREALNTFMSQRMPSHQQTPSASAPPPNNMQAAPTYRFKNLSRIHRDQLIQIFRFGAETLENGSVQEQELILQIVLNLLQNG